MSMFGDTAKEDLYQDILNFLEDNPLSEVIDIISIIAEDYEKKED